MPEHVDGTLISVKWLLFIVKFDEMSYYKFIAGDMENIKFS